MNLKAHQFDQLNQATQFSQRLRILHQSIAQQYPEICRVAVAIYDPHSDLLKTYAYSSEIDSPLTNYEAKLRDCPSLFDLAEHRNTRVINDLSRLANDHHQHSQSIYSAGFQSSYTFPLIWENEFLGFLFFNSKEKNYFDETITSELDTIGFMLSVMISNERTQLRTLIGTIKSALQMTNSKDPETGAHIERMSRYARIIAKDLSDQYELDDQYIEQLFLFAPLHDIGKICIPDSVLKKPGKLTDEEYNIMKKHSDEGKKLIDQLINNLGLTGVSHIEMLRNIAHYHHENMDGSGYPERLRGLQIPLEARIVAVADIFDALTSKRSYKEAWSNDLAIDTIESLTPDKFDPDCVAALIKNRARIEEIQSTFQDAN